MCGHRPECADEWKTVDVKKSQVGLTIIRESTINHESFTERAPKLGGLVEFYRSPDRVLWTPTGVNLGDQQRRGADAKIIRRF